MRRALLACALCAAVAAVADVRPPDVKYKNIPYNGRFTFSRIKFNPTRWGPGNYMWGLDLKWNHDYPRADSHFVKILRETTTIEANQGGGNIYGFDDPEVFRYPVAYVSEPGFWAPTDAEAAAFRDFLLKGGFAIFDDFQGWHWLAFEEAMRKALPQHRLVQLSAEHPIFDAFFKVDPYSFTHPFFRAQGGTRYYGVFEDNDAAKRLLLIANYNQDIGEYWEFSDTGWVPIDISNEAYKLGVNYVVYGLTH